MNYKEHTDSSIMRNVFKNINKWMPFGKVSEISPVELKSILEDSESDIQILDVRTHLEW